MSKKFIALVLKEDRESTLQFMAASYITLYRKHGTEQNDDCFTFLHLSFVLSILLKLLLLPQPSA